MRRIAVSYRPRLPITLAAIVTALLLSTLPFSAAQTSEARKIAPPQKESRRPSLIVKVKNPARTSELKAAHNLRSLKSISRGTDAIMVVEDTDDGLLKNRLSADPDVVWAVKNDILPLDGGETVLPLDGGETVLPLDGGETVLPLDSETDLKITGLLDGGETVLPLEELRTIRNAFTALAQWLTPSKKLLLQPAFLKIGLYPSVLRATGRGVVVADLDTGADTCHPALHGVVTYTFIDGGETAPEDCATNATPIGPGFGHGTAVASLIRVTAPEATVWAMRVFDNSGTALTSDIYEAIVYAADHGVDVINMSFGTASPSVPLADAVAYARERGVVLVAAGGNSNAEPLMYPAAISGVKGIAATTNSDLKASFSNYATQTFLSAPGYGLWVAYPNSQLKYVAGTSYASPLAAAEAALVIDGYQRMLSGHPLSWMIDAAMWFGAQPIDLLNPRYIFKLGHGRMYIPTALNVTGVPPYVPPPAVPGTPTTAPAAQ